MLVKTKIKKSSNFYACAVAVADTKPPLEIYILLAGFALSNGILQLVIKFFLFVVYGLNMVKTLVEH